VAGEASGYRCRSQGQRLQAVSTKRVCTECSKPFEQTFGGRPRKKCYECVPPRLNQAQQKGQRQRSASTVGKHAGSSVDVVAPSGASGHHAVESTQGDPHVSGDPASTHCPWCGAFVPVGRTFCNPRHRAMFAERVAAAKSKRPDVRPPMRGGRRPLERVRELRENQVAGHHADVRQRARERSRQEAA
jgi:hypothetical protein